MIENQMPLWPHDYNSLPLPTALKPQAGRGVGWTLGGLSALPFRTLGSALGFPHVLPFCTARPAAHSESAPS